MAEPTPDHESKLRDTFDRYLIAEVKAFGGIPQYKGHVGEAMMALKDAIAEHLAVLAAARRVAAPQEHLDDEDLRAAADACAAEARRWNEEPQLHPGEPGNAAGAAAQWRITEQRLRAARSAGAAPHEEPPARWQPIETAPTDGPLVLVMARDGTLDATVTRGEVLKEGRTNKTWTHWAIPPSQEPS